MESSMITKPTCVKIRNFNAAYRRFGPPQIPMRKNIGSRTDVARTISTRLNPRALNFAARWEVPSPQTMSAPTNGISQRRDKTPTMSGSSEETLHEPLAEHEEEQDDQSHDDDPGVALHLARLPLPQTPARADCLEADGVHGAVDYPPIEDIALHRHPHPPAADGLHDSAADIPVEPV